MKHGELRSVVGGGPLFITMSLSLGCRNVHFVWKSDEIQDITAGRLKSDNVAAFKMMIMVLVRWESTE